MTIKDIAAKAGVSPSTVSRVLSGSTRIGRETTLRVQTIMQELDYRPNQLARSLVSKTSNIVAVVLPMAPQRALGEPFLFDVLRGIGSEAGKRGYHMLLSTGCDPEGEYDAICNLTQGGIAAGMILLTSKVEDLLAEALLRQRFPFVVLGHPERDNQINWVDNDNVGAGRAATEYLMKRGCRRIAFVGASNSHRVTVDRLEGWRQALSAASMPIDEGLILPVNFAQASLDRDRALRMLSSPNRPDGILAAHDEQALAMMGVASELGLRIPQDISFIGFNNTVAAQCNTPPLCSVDLDPEALGQHCFSLLFQAMERRQGAAHRALVPYRLVIRDSVR